MAYPSGNIFTPFILTEKGFYIKVKQEKDRRRYSCFFVSAGHDGLFHLK